MKIRELGLVAGGLAFVLADPATPNESVSQVELRLMERAPQINWKAYAVQRNETNDPSSTIWWIKNGSTDETPDEMCFFGNVLLLLSQPHKDSVRELLFR